eukprot:6818362-Prymnesium_polylepis.3
MAARRPASTGRLALAVVCGPPPASDPNYRRRQLCADGRCAVARVSIPPPLDDGTALARPHTCPALG